METIRLRCNQAGTIHVGIARQLARQELRRNVNKYERRRQLLPIFRSVDTSNDGYIDAREFGRLLSTLGQDLTAAEIRDRMREIDVDGSGKLDFHEFGDSLEQWQAEELRDVFAYFDSDDSGSISVAELSLAIQALGEENVSPEEADICAARVDSDGSGLIDCDEFCVYMSPLMAITHAHEFSLSRAGDGASVKMVIDDLGVELTADVEARQPSVLDSGEMAGRGDGRDSAEVIEGTNAMQPMLKKLPMLQHLGQSELTALAARLVMKEFEAGSTIIQQGETGDVMFFLNEGTAAAVVDAVGVVRNYSSGDYFGEVALLRDQPRGASILAGRTGCRCGVLDRASFAAYADVTVLDAQVISYTHAHYLLTALVSAEETPCGLAVTFEHHKRHVRHDFECEALKAQNAVSHLRQHQAKLRLRRDIEQHKQRKALRAAFDDVDVSGDGVIDLDELGVLLSTLGETLTGAELRSRARELDRDGSGTLDFDEFASAMVKWQEQELKDVFEFFDDDASGSISVSELSTAIQALGEQGISSEEADARAVRVDSDGSGLIDMDEFCVYMKSLMSITQRHEYEVIRQDDDTTVKMVVTSLGIQLTDSKGTVAYNFFKLVRAEESSAGITLTVLHHKAEIKLGFATSHAAGIVAMLRHQQAKLSLRHDIQQHKQRLRLRAVFNLADTDRTGCIEIDELPPLLQTLGHLTLSRAEIEAKVKEMDLDCTGDISFDEFALWMQNHQEKELLECFNYFDRNNSGTISIVELAQMIRSMGEQMTMEQIKALAERVDSDNSGEIDCDEFCVLLKPMLSLSDCATFYVAQENGSTGVVAISGLGIELTCDGVSTLYGFSKLAEFEALEKSGTRNAGLSLAVKNRDGNLQLVFFESTEGQEIVDAIRTQNGKLSLRSAIARSKVPKQASLATALVILRTESSHRTDSQLAMVRQFLSENDLFQLMELTSELQQVQCCRYLHVERYERGDRIFEEGHVAYNIFHIIDGVVSIRKGGQEVRQQWKGASFGALTVKGEIVSKRTPCIVALDDVFLIKLSRADYLRICGSLDTEVIAVLGKGPEDRTDPDLEIVRGLFQETALFRMLYYPVLQLWCARKMRLEAFKTNDTVAKAGESDNVLRIVLRGNCTSSTPGKKQCRELGGGDSVGFSCVLGLKPEDQLHASTVTATTDCVFATLTRDDFTRVNTEIGEQAVAILDKSFFERSDADISSLLLLFNHLPFISKLRSRLLQQHCCRFLRVKRVQPKQVLYKQGEVGDEMCIILTGSLKVEKWRGSSSRRAASGGRGEVARCRVGTAFGESVITANSELGRRHETTVTANDDAIVATLSRQHYLQITRTAELQLQIDNYWEMLMNDAYGDERSDLTEFVDAALYHKLHLAIAKTLHEDWSPQDAAEQVQADWLNDLARHNLGADSLNHRQFSDALFEFVDEWCTTISIPLYSKFLDKVWCNIRSFWCESETKGTRYKISSIESIHSIHKDMQRLQADGARLKKDETKQHAEMFRKMQRQDADADADADPDAEKVVFRSADKHFRDGDSFEMHGIPIGARERHVGKAQLAFLTANFGANFTSAEEEDYFKEMLQMRAIGPPQWTDQLEAQFRDQLRVTTNVVRASETLSESAMQRLLDHLQEGYIVGFPENSNALQLSKKRAAAQLNDMLANDGLEFEDDEALEVALARLLRKAEGPPFWNGVDDDKALKTLLEGNTRQKYGSAFKGATGDESHTGEFRGATGAELRTDGPYGAHDSSGTGGAYTSGNGFLAANGGIVVSSGLVFPSLPRQTTQLGTMSPKSVATAGGWIANLTVGTWMFGAPSSKNLTRKGPMDLQSIGQHQRKLSQSASDRPGFHRPEDQVIDVSHVKPKVDCGQHARRKTKGKKKKAKRSKLPTFESHLAAFQSDDSYSPSQQADARKQRTKHLRLPPLESGGRSSVGSHA